jgi:hypothetical protein
MAITAIDGNSDLDPRISNETVKKAHPLTSVFQGMIQKMIDDHTKLQGDLKFMFGLTLICDESYGTGHPKELQERVVLPKELREKVRLMVIKFENDPTDAEMKDHVQQSISSVKAALGQLLLLNEEALVNLYNYKDSIKEEKFPNYACYNEKVRPMQDLGNTLTAKIHRFANEMNALKDEEWKKIKEVLAQSKQRFSERFQQMAQNKVADTAWWDGAAIYFSAGVVIASAGFIGGLAVGMKR